MRIIAGTAKGRPLLGPKNAEKIRPTSDRVKETLFNVLGQWFEAQAVLDLFAGTGALAFEALSRGASRAVLVEIDREALALCRSNAAALGFSAQTEIFAQPVTRALEQLGKRGSPFDLIFADPPYALEALAGVVEQVGAAGLLAPGGQLVIEHSKREEAPEALGALERTDQRSFGDTRVSFYAGRVP